jgi:hypothetical protein
MLTASEIRNATAAYVAGTSDCDSFQDWFARASLGNFADLEARTLSNRIEGVLAEASHVGWPEGELREELANAIRPFVRSREQPENPIVLRPESEVPFSLAPSVKYPFSVLAQEL